MSFKIASSPHQHSQRSTSQLMRLVVLACIPGIAVQAVLFGYGVLIQLLLAVITAWLSEALVLMLRRKAVFIRLKDNSAMLTAVLLAVALVQRLCTEGHWPGGTLLRGDASVPPT